MCSRWSSFLPSFSTHLEVGVPFAQAYMTTFSPLFHTATIMARCVHVSSRVTLLVRVCVVCCVRSDSDVVSKHQLELEGFGFPASDRNKSLKHHFFIRKIDITLPYISHTSHESIRLRTHINFKYNCRHISSVVVCLISFIHPNQSSNCLSLSLVLQFLQIFILPLDIIHLHQHRHHHSFSLSQTSMFRSRSFLLILFLCFAYTMMSNETLGEFIKYLIAAYAILNLITFILPPVSHTDIHTAITHESNRVLFVDLQTLISLHSFSFFPFFFFFFF